MADLVMLSSQPAASSASAFRPIKQIDILDLFNSSGPPSRSDEGAAATSSSPASSSQHFTLASVPYNAKLSLNEGGNSAIRFEAAAAGPPAESWKYAGSASPCVLRSCCFSADSNYFITGGGWNNTEIRIWNPSTRTKVATLSGHTERINAVTSFRLNGKIMLASGSSDTTIRIWEFSDSSLPPLAVLRATIEAGSPVYALIFCRSRLELISGQQYHCSIKVWSATYNWKCINTLHPTSNIKTLSLSADDSKLVSQWRPYPLEEI